MEEDASDLHVRVFIKYTLLTHVLIVDVISRAGAALFDNFLQKGQ